MTTAQRERLAALLAAHCPADAAEARDLAHIRTFIYANIDPFDRGLLPGHLTGSAFVLAGERLLLTHHRKLGIWIQLGGHAEAERVAEEVALREAREESGLPDLAFHPEHLLPDGRPRLLDVDVHDIPARGAEPAHQHLDLRFVLATARPEALAPDLRETRALEWVSLHEAIRRGDPGLRRAVTKLLRR